MISPDLLERIEQLTLGEQLALLELLSRSIRKTVQVEEDSLSDDEAVDPAELFREGWADAMEGRTHPIATLWDDLEDE
ncbi:MAG: hypothetical protein IT319_21000 [Anaerolineae bacterium]|nr:hypothetical protein [Anaerolineae bacterium]